MSEKNVASVRFVNSKSEKIFNLKEHALIGISPFNSYYSEENLKRLFAWGLANFKKISVFIPTEISSYTLQAVGCSEEQAKKKTRKHDKNLEHKALRALIANNLSDNEAKNQIIFFSDLMNNRKYLEIYDICIKLYETNEDFRNGCLETSKWVLASKCSSDFVNKEALNIAAKYFLAELPLYLNTPEIFDVSSSLIVYKDLPSIFLNKIYSGNSFFSSLVYSQQGYLAVDFRKEIL